MLLKSAEDIASQPSATKQSGCVFVSEIALDIVDY